MTGIASATPPGWPRGRLALALLLSLLLHWMIVDGWHLSGAPRAVTGTPLLQARLEPPAVDRVLSAAGAPAVEVEAGDDRKRASTAGRQPPERRVPPPRSPATPQSAPATGPDLRFYTARELDRYPVPLTSLNPVFPDGESVMRFWLGIDATGVVVEVEPGNAGGQGAGVSAAREILLATRFEPAFKDGRPVRSRVLLELKQVFVGHSPQ